MPPFKAPDQKPRNDDQLTVHMPKAMKKELIDLAEALGYVRGTRNDFYLRLLNESLPKARREAGEAKSK
jgi:hypothetical protein